MRNRIDIDEIFSRAIIREIGERLQASLSEGGELTDSLRRQINRLRELDEEASSTAPDLPGDEIGNNSSAEVTLSGALDKPLADAAPTNARLATMAEDFRWRPAIASPQQSGYGYENLGQNRSWDVARATFPVSP